MYMYVVTSLNKYSVYICHICRCTHIYIYIYMFIYMFIHLSIYWFVHRIRYPMHTSAFNIIKFPITAAIIFTSSGRCTPFGSYVQMDSR